MIVHLIKNGCIKIRFHPNMCDVVSIDLYEDDQITNCVVSFSLRDLFDREHEFTLENGTLETYAKICSIFEEDYDNQLFCLLMENARERLDLMTDFVSHELDQKMYAIQTNRHTQDSHVTSVDDLLEFMEIAQEQLEQVIKNLDDNDNNIQTVSFDQDILDEWFSVKGGKTLKELKRIATLYELEFKPSISKAQLKELFEDLLE